MQQGLQSKIWNKKRRIQIKENKIIVLLVGNNRTFDCKVELLIRMISYDKAKEYTEIINWRWEDDNFLWIQWNKQVRRFQGRVRMITT